jgi:type VI secretion system protein VasG
MAEDVRLLLRDATAPLRRAVQEATERSVTEGHGEVGTEHLFLALLERPETDFGRILAHYGVNRSDLERQILRALRTWPRGSLGQPRLGAGLAALITAARERSLRTLDTPVLRSGIVLLCFLESPRRFGAPAGLWPALARILPEALWQEFDALTRSSAEQSEAGQAGAQPAPSNEALDRYAVDLTAEARAGRIDPIHGRNAEIQQLINVLGRRRQNNPVLVGDAGVGKTAIVEALALRVASGDVPAPLRRVSVRMLDLGLLQAGALMRGEFEARLRAVIDAVEASARPVILFIDEAHALIGAGGNAGQSDAATLLKPALARGSLRMIAATTWGEYKRYLEKDPALTRRFQLIKVEEPDEDSAQAMLRALVGRLSRHHEVAILDEAVVAAVTLSQRYVAGRRLPDKAVSVLDTACARVALAKAAMPLEVEEAAQRRATLKQKIAALAHDARGHEENPHQRRERDRLSRELADADTSHESLRQRWQEERGIVASLAAARAPGGDAEQVAELERELLKLQGMRPMVPENVDRRVVAGIIAEWTGIPLDTILANENQSVADLGERLSHLVLGQPDAVDAVARRIRAHRVELTDPNQPVGIFLLAGPEGTGKRRMAEAVAELLYGGTRGLVTLNLVEYQEAHTLSALRGAPPGYVGYGQGGILTEAVRRNPYCVLLLENVERAHPDVLALIGQACDRATIDDGDGVAVDFRHALIFMTTNLDPREAGNVPGIGRRAQVLGFRPLGQQALRVLLRTQFAAMVERFAERHGLDLAADQDAASATLAAALSTGSAQQIWPLLERKVMEPLARLILDVRGDARKAALLRIVPTDAGLEFRLLDAAGELVTMSVEILAPATAPPGAPPAMAPPPAPPPPAPIAVLAPPPSIREIRTEMAGAGAHLWRSWR